MIDLTVGVRRAHHHIRLSKGTKHDMAVWLHFLHALMAAHFSSMTSGTHLQRAMVLDQDQRAMVLF